MQSFYAERFDREMGCTEAEWLRWLPNAIGEQHWKLQANAAGVRIDDGALGLTWRTGAPRVIALMRIPRLLVSFRFAGLDHSQRYAFMKRFDLYMQRGGG
nr:hypothetical protein [Rhodoferax sp.]